VDGPLATVLDRFFFLIACGLRLWIGVSAIDWKSLVVCPRGKKWPGSSLSCDKKKKIVPGLCVMRLSDMIESRCILCGDNKRGSWKRFVFLPPRQYPSIISWRSASHGLRTREWKRGSRSFIPPHVIFSSGVFFIT
jgi:hypothetical protein